MAKIRDKNNKNIKRIIFGILMTFVFLATSYLGFDFSPLKLNDNPVSTVAYAKSSSKSGSSIKSGSFKSSSKSSTSSGGFKSGSFSNGSGSKSNSGGFNSGSFSNGSGSNSGGYKSGSFSNSGGGNSGNSTYDSGSEGGSSFNPFTFFNGFGRGIYYGSSSGSGGSILGYLIAILVVYIIIKAIKHHFDNKYK